LFSATYIKTGMMPGANYPLTVEGAFSQRCSIVGAIRGRSKKFIPMTSQQNICFSGFELFHLTGSQVVTVGNFIFLDGHGVMVCEKIISTIPTMINNQCLPAEQLIS
jgi:hypothetical protein